MATLPPIFTIGSAETVTERISWPSSIAYGLDMKSSCGCYKQESQRLPVLWTKRAIFEGPPDEGAHPCSSFVHQGKQATLMGGFYFKIRGISRSTYRPEIDHQWTTSSAVYLLSAFVNINDLVRFVILIKAVSSARKTLRFITRGP